MTQLAASGFGVATLPSAVLERLGSGSGVYALRCTSELDALPIHASWLIDPGTTALDTIVESALSFAGFASRTTARPSAKKVPKR
jgi:DNA-binding transcriptional LysR family regulator